jgi:hypothetical protein
VNASRRLNASGLSSSTRLLVHAIARKTSVLSALLDNTSILCCVNALAENIKLVSFQIRSGMTTTASVSVIQKRSISASTKDTHMITPPAHAISAQTRTSRLASPKDLTMPLIRKLVAAIATKMLSSFVKLLVSSSTMTLVTVNANNPMQMHAKPEDGNSTSILIHVCANAVKML